MRERWRRIVFGVAAAVSALLIGYVAYVHVLSASRMAAPGPKDFRESFGSSDRLPPGYDVQKQGDLSWAIQGGRLAVSGRGRAGDALTFAGPARRFDDGVLSLRFRSRAADPVEVFVGLEQKSLPRAITASYVGGATPIVTLGGDISGPLRSADIAEDVRVDASPGDWHLLSFQFAPRYSTASVLLDGRPMTNIPAMWSQGEMARAVFGVRLRADVDAADVEFETLTLQTIDEVFTSFDDTFNGEILDTQRWIIQYPDSNYATMAVHLLPEGRGLFLEGNAVADTGAHVPFYFVRTAPFVLRTLHARADVTIDELHEARVFFGFMGSSGATVPGKVFDIGVSERSGTAIIDVTGAWSDTGEIKFDLGPKVPMPSRVRLETSYDATTGLATATFDGKVVSTHPLDLKPLDLVSLRIGSGAFAVGGKSRVTVHRIAIEMR